MISEGMRYTYPVIYYVPLMFYQFCDSPDNLFLWDYSCRNMIENVRHFIKDTEHFEHQEKQQPVTNAYSLIIHSSCVFQNLYTGLIFCWTQKMI